MLGKGLPKIVCLLYLFNLRMVDTRGGGSHGRNDPPPPPELNPAQLLALLLEEREASRQERQAHLAVLQQLAANAQNNNNNNNHDDQRSTLSDFQKTTPPVFAKTVQPLEAEDWLRTIENNLEVARVTNEEKVLFATHYLTGPARAWWEATKAMQPAGQVITWEEFKVKFRKVHVPSGLISRKRDEFRRLRQGGKDVVKYLEEFMDLARYAPEDTNTEEKKMDHFLNGLHTEMQCVLVTHTFADLEALVDKAIQMESKRNVMFEDRKRRMANQGSSSSQKPRTYPPNSKPAPPPYRTPAPKGGGARSGRGI